MDEPLSDAEKIRNKRLAKLGGTPSTQPRDAGQAEGSVTPSSGASSPSTEPSQSYVPRSTAKASAIPATPAAKSNPFTKLGLNDGDEPKSKPAINVVPLASTRERSAPGAKRNPESDTTETWQDETLSSIFRVSLNSEKDRDYLGHKLTYLENVRSELEEEGSSLRLTISMLEQVIIEAAQNQGRIPPFDYLLGCWKRVSKAFRTHKAKNAIERLDILREARRLCMSYCIFALTTPELFGHDADAEDSFATHLLLDQTDDRGIDHDFLLELASRLDEDESAIEAIVRAVEEISERLAELDMDKDYKPHVNALRNLVRYPAIVNAFVASPRFLPDDLPAEAIEAQTILGPFFQISPLQAEVSSKYFQSLANKDQGQILNAQSALRMALRTHQTELLDIINHIIKTGKEPRERTLDWFARSVNLNHKRRAMQVDRDKVSSDGYMINLTVCLDQLCEPFMDSTFSKVDRIDVTYLRRHPRVDIKDETKLNADQQTSDAFFANEADGQSNFISEVFFLTLAAHHYGTEAAANMLTELERTLRYMEKTIANLEASLQAERHKMNPHMLARVEKALKDRKDQFEKGTAYRYAIQGVLLDNINQGRSMQFMRYVMVWLLRLVTPAHDFPKSSFKLPLPEEQIMVFRTLPEYFLEDVVANFKFISRNMPHVITSTQADELVMLCVTFLRSGEYVKNPYLKAGLVTILYHGSVPYRGRTKGVLGDVLLSHPFATNYLLHALMKFFIDAEHTGAHTAFYDKFNIRYEIFQIIKCIWSNPVYRDQLSAEAKDNVEFFVQFVNLLMNDVTYVLDESLSSFTKIHDLQQQLRDASGMDEQERNEKQETLSDAQGKAKNFMVLTNEGVSMMKLFTETLAESFTMPEIVQRLADMLDYNLDAMVGPKSSQLKVENPQEYGFNPKILLAEIIDVYLHLQEKERFIFAVARDGRSYKPANFDNATLILKKWSLKSPERMQEWQDLAAKFKKAKEVDEQAEEDLGEIPDEYLDPLLATLMEDPVILPASKTIIDRSTIRSHLLSDPTDPFNRAPLKIEDVIPATALKAQIDAFKTEKKSKRLAGVGVMDTSPG